MAANAFPAWAVALVAIIMGWFAVGIIGNIRRGNAVLAWLQTALPRLGPKTTLRWLGTSVVELGIAPAKPPFRRVDLVVVLEPRDVPFLWLGARLSGRRDMLILRAQLSSAPRLEYQVCLPESWTGRRARAEALARRWAEQPLGDHRCLAPAASLPVSLPGAETLLRAAQAAYGQVWLLAVRRTSPQLELHVPLPSPKGGDAAPIIEALRQLALQVG